MKAILIPAVTAFVVTWGVILLLLRGVLLRHVVDHPNERSLHKAPIPRTGGLGLMSGVLAAWALSGSAVLLPLVVGAVLLMLLSFIDDVRSLSAGVRFLTHFIVAGLFAGMTVAPTIGWLPSLAVVVVMVWMTNLYNFMDGSDGLAGGMALFGFGSYALAGWLAGDMALATASLAIAAAALGFLCFNFHPARIFMGDAGSIPLGFLSAALGLLGWQRGIWPLWFPLLVFSPFVVDATVTLLKRLLRGEKVWEAHREHYYQRLVQLGWGHRRTALAEYGVMASVTGGAIWVLPQSSAVQVAFGLGCLLAYFALMKIIDHQWKSGRASDV